MDELPPPPVSTPPAPPPPATSGPLDRRAAVVVGLVWVGAAGTSLLQKLNGDSLLRDFDASAIQVQQVNSQVTAHAVVALVIASAVTVLAFVWPWSLRNKERHAAKA